MLRGVALLGPASGSGLEDFGGRFCVEWVLRIVDVRSVVLRSAGEYDFPEFLTNAGKQEWLAM